MQITQTFKRTIEITIEVEAENEGIANAEITALAGSISRQLPHKARVVTNSANKIIFFFHDRGSVLGKAAA